MARIRTVKPELFRHETLFELEQKYELPIRLAWIGLFTVADREGRFRWKPRILKLDVLPFDEIDFEDILDALHEVDLVQKYQVGEEFYGFIPTWSQHQVINTREAQSTLPSATDESAVLCVHVHAHATHVHAQGEGKGKGKGREGEVEGSAEGNQLPADAGLPPRIFRLWNSFRGKLPEAKGMNAQRKKQCEARWKEKPDPYYWQEVIEKMADSEFCTGNNDRGWIANIDFLLRPGTHLKVQEGQYDGKARRPMTKGEVTAQAHQEMWNRLEAEEQAQKEAEVIDG